MDIKQDEEHAIDGVFNRDASNPDLEGFHVIVPDYGLADIWSGKDAIAYEEKWQNDQVGQVVNRQVFF